MTNFFLLCKYLQLRTPITFAETEVFLTASIGVVIPDEYRWMETAGAELDPWIDSEDAHARAQLDAMPGRAALESRIAELWREGRTS